MRIIRHEKPEEIEVKCSGYGNGGGGCGAVLGIELKDIYVTESSDYTGGKDYHPTICCPNCFILTDIEKIPSHWKWTKNTHGTPKEIIDLAKKD